MLRACAPTAAWRRVWRRTATTGAGSVRLFWASYYEWRCAVFLSVLRSDGQLPAALCAAVSSRVQRHHRSVFRRQNRSERRAEVERAFRALPASLPAVVWDTAHGVRGVLRSIPAGGKPL